MTEKKNTPIKEGDLVTLGRSEFNTASNTYRVHLKVDDQCVLSHPLAPECFIIRKEEELNIDFPSMQNTTEKCLVFLKKHKDILGFWRSIELDAMCFSYVVKKQISNHQRDEIINMCGKAASVLMNSSYSSAVMYIKENKFLLDEHTNSMLNIVSHLMANPMAIKSTREKLTLFNIAGYLLAQSSSN